MSPAETGRDESEETHRVRICFVSAALPDAPCGIGDYTSHLASAIAAAGEEVVVLTTDRPELRSPEDFEVRPISTNWALGATPRVARAILAERPDIVHAQFPGLGLGRGFAMTTLPWMLKSGRPRLPVALTLHEFDRLSARHRLRVAAGAIPCSLIVAPSRGVARSARRYLKWRPWSVIEEVPLASNVVPAPAIEPAAFRRRPDELVVGYWGFIRPDKGLETLIAAFSRVRESRPARLVLAGDPGPDDEYVRQIRKEIHDAGLEGDAFCTGPLAAEALSATLLGFDVCALPFRDGLTENRGSYSAAVAHGIPVVTTSAERTGLDVESNTWYVPPRAGVRLAEAILAHGSSPHRPSSATVSDEWKAIAERHLALYRRVVAS